MSISKQAKDYLLKALWGKESIPQGLFEASEYFRHNGGIKFDIEKKENEYIAISNNFRHGSIIASAKDIQELEKNIIDAILTSFEIPSSYSKEANIKEVNRLRDTGELKKVGSEREYAFA